MKVVARDGGAQRARECLEYRFDLVVLVLPFGLDVQVAAGRFGEALEEVAEPFGRHVADVLAREAGVPDQLDASAEIEQHGGPALVHRQAEAVAADAELRSERSADRLSERDGRVLDRMVLVDLQTVAEIAHRHGAKLFVDNTFATPYNTNPLDLGADVVIHSLTKYIGGHGDLLGGAVISNDEQFLRQCRLGTLMHFGAVIAPFTAFLVCRGMKTLGVRMRQYNESALKIARWLESDPRIETVRYPLLESNPQYEIARRQMRGGGGMITFDVRGGLEAGKRFINHLKLCSLAVSLGDTETLVEQAAAMTHTMIPREVREAAGITDGMIRMSVGLEDADDIIADLKQALDA